MPDVEVKGKKIPIWVPGAPELAMTEAGIALGSSLRERLVGLGVGVRVPKEEVVTQQSFAGHVQRDVIPDVREILKSPVGVASLVMQVAVETGKLMDKGRLGHLRIDDLPYRGSGKTVSEVLHIAARMPGVRVGADDVALLLGPTPAHYKIFLALCIANSILGRYSPPALQSLVNNANRTLTWLTGAAMTRGKGGVVKQLLAVTMLLQASLPPQQPGTLGDVVGGARKVMLNPTKAGKVSGALSALENVPPADNKLTGRIPKEPTASGQEMVFPFFRISESEVSELASEAGVPMAYALGYVRHFRAKKGETRAQARSRMLQRLKKRKKAQGDM